MFAPHLLHLLALSTRALAGVHELWWNVTYVQNANPDGLFERRVIGVNGSWPYVYSNPYHTCDPDKICILAIDRPPSLSTQPTLSFFM
jgi:hypothetical protein